MEYQTTPEEAKFWRDKMVLDRRDNATKGHTSADRAQYMLGVDPKNYELIMDNRAYEKGQEVEKKIRTEEQVFAQLKNEAIMYLATKERGKATEIIVKHIKKKFYIFTTRSDEKPEVWVYQAGIYKPNGRSIIKEVVREILGEAFTNHLCNEIISKIEADTFIESSSFFAHNYKDEIPVINGILNIFTRELSEFTPDKIFFNKCPVYYDPNATYDIIDQFLSEVLSNSEDKRVFYEIGGYCLYKEYNFEKAFMFVGNGRNGKGKSLELIKRLIGPENCYSLPLSALSYDNADISQLFGKMVNLAGDISFADLKDTSVFKSLTGRDLITAKRKFLTALTFENYAKFIFACNELPKVYDLSKGFWDRWVLLEFPYYFASKDEWECKSDKERKALGWKLRDEDIISKIASPEALSGLLNAFLDGLERLSINKNFSSTKGSEQIKDLWVRKSDSFMAFVMDNIEESYDGFIFKKDLRQRFAKYCKEYKIKNASDKAIKIILESNFGVTETRKQTAGDYWEWVWEGVKWKE